MKIKNKKIIFIIFCFFSIFILSATQNIDDYNIENTLLRQIFSNKDFLKQYTELIDNNFFWVESNFIQSDDYYKIGIIMKDNNDKYKRINITIERKTNKILRIIVHQNE